MVHTLLRSAVRSATRCSSVSFSSLSCCSVALRAVKDQLKAKLLEVLS
jgi:hypothetical protein